VWLNGVEVGGNEGGHVPFSFDIGPAAKAGENRLVVRVEDTQDPLIPRGKQSINGVSRSIFYYCTTGIWQTVWLEPVSRVRIEDVVASAELNPDTLKLAVRLHGAAHGKTVSVAVSDADATVATASKTVSGGVVEFSIPIAGAKRWSPDAPNLYNLRIGLADGPTEIDVVESYAGIRTVSIEDGYVLLNDEPIYLQMVLDQGYWRTSGLTAPTDEALKADVEWCKKYGYNGARKHQKVEDPRWLYWCDKLGLMVWGEMANAFGWSREAGERMMREWERAVRRDLSHPCVIAWTPVNESWGVPDLRKSLEQVRYLERITMRTRELDPTRPVVDNDGWQHSEASDLHTLHDYSKTGKELIERFPTTEEARPGAPETHWGLPYLAMGARYLGQPVLITECGGFLSLPPDVPKEKLDSLYSSYGVLQTDEALVESYRDIMEAIASIPYVVGFCYTQLTDVEQEQNGLLTYDRATKIDPDRIKEIHQNMVAKRAER
jgi:beta-galactosidase/beta-glucuronidase